MKDLPVRRLGAALLATALLTSCKERVEPKESAAPSPKTKAREAASESIKDIDLLTSPAVLPRDREAALRRLLSGAFANDPRLGPAVAAFFPDYSPSALALVLTKMPPGDNRAAFIVSYRDFLLAVSEIRGLVAHLKAFPPGDERSSILQAIASSSALFSPDTIIQFEKLFPAAGDRGDFVLGIHERFSAIRGDGQMLSEAKRYLAVGPSSLTGQIIIQSLMKRGIFSRMDGVSDWVLSLPDDLGRVADLPMLTRLASTAPRKGIEYLQGLLDRESTVRSNEALESFAGAFSRARPAEAISWALNLPEDLGHARSRVLITTYTTLALSNEALAEEFAGVVTDKEALERIEAVRRDAPNRKPPRQ